ncbi:MAG TPA: translation initiation factor IF-2 subunit beta [Candidatus Thermoplasmatota archaeon]|nr:translation initiation factor IF-2 subunit beta [Candidatus Thermoplasmatota archaeon]
MDEKEYLTLLREAHAHVPKNVGNKERWKLPKTEVVVEGRMTFLRNYRAILDSLRREEPHVTKFLLSNVGTAGSLDGDRLSFTGKVPEAKVTAVLADYVETFVRCNECGAPDTHLEKDGRVTLLKCEACGARKPVKVRKARAVDTRLREGAVLEVKLTHPGQRGEAKAEAMGYVFVVPGGKVGTTVWVKVNKLAGKMAFSELTVAPKA